MERFFSNKYITHNKRLSTLPGFILFTLDIWHPKLKKLVSILRTLGATLPYCIMVSVTFIF